jgi:hypothetical protein
MSPSVDDIVTSSISSAGAPHPCSGQPVIVIAIAAPPA